MSIVNHPQHFQRSAKTQSFNRSSAARVVRPFDQGISICKRACVVLLTFALLATVFAGVIALRVAVWLPAFHH